MHLSWTKSYRTGLTPVLFLTTLVFLSSCGGEIDEYEAFNQHFADPGYQETLQGEVHEVMQIAQSSILAAVTADETMVSGNCKPDFDLKLTAVVVQFHNNPGCKVVGEIRFEFFKLLARVDLELVGMKYIESMTLDADLSLKNLSDGISVDWEFLNGRIKLSALSFLGVDELILNGNAQAQLKSSAIGFNSRTNAFDSDSRNGLTLMSEFSPGTKNIRACFLKGGEPRDPNAGSVSSCLSLLN